ncbi:hypothetical protein CSOJ01_00910 [Colletotrichum sojae]|uniref:Uncharacterized protein n=1 Tax=Colletotrichum sojae TaxID=2175907 RepID=A0A8H6JW44_9PEZI|nr:hypothetical protein CSOJ01_00910 [Colletotrichum sojae]
MAKVAARMDLITVVFPQRQDFARWPPSSWVQPHRSSTELDRGKRPLTAGRRGRPTCLRRRHPLPTVHVNGTRTHGSRAKSAQAAMHLTARRRALDGSH